MTRLIVRPRAEADVEEAVSWYEEQTPGLGARLLGELGTTLARIRESPLQFPAVGRGVRRALLRRFPYAVYFLVDTEARRIVIAVLHQRRRPSAWKGRLRDAAGT